MATLNQQWLESNKFRSYPFQDGEYSFTAPFQNEDVNSLFLDARLVFQNTNLTNNSNKAWFINTLSLPTLNLKLTNQETNQIIDLGTPQFNSNVGTFKAVQWNNTNQNIIVILILNNNHSVLNQSGDLQFDNPPLFVSKVLEIEPLRVTSLNLDTAAWILSGNSGDLIEGNNISLKVNPEIPIVELRKLNEDSLRPNVTRIVINAKPGLGAGRRDVDCFSTITDILTINNISGKNGNFFFLPDDCYRIMQPVDNSFNPVPAKLKIENDCLPCCDCDDYIKILEDIRILVNEGLEIKSIWSQAEELFNEVKTIWEDKFSCLGNQCLTQLFGYSFTGWIITVQVWIGNVQDCVQNGGDVTVTFSGGDIDAELISGSGMIYSAEGSYIQVDPIKIDKNQFMLSDNSPIKSGGYRLFVFSVRMKNTADRQDGHAIQIDAEVNACNNPEPVTLSTTVALKGNINKT